MIGRHPRFHKVLNCRVGSERNVPPLTEGEENPTLGLDHEQEDKPQDHEQLSQSLGERQSPTIDMVKEADGNSAKRDLSGSDDSDAGQSKPAQRMKGEHGAVARIKPVRSNRWGTVNDAAGEELKQAPSQQRRTSLSSGGVSNNLRGNQDPVLAVGGKVKSLQPVH